MVKFLNTNGIHYRPEELIKAAPAYRSWSAIPQPRPHMGADAPRPPAPGFLRLAWPAAGLFPGVHVKRLPGERIGGGERATRPLIAGPIPRDQDFLPPHTSARTAIEGVSSVGSGRRSEKTSTIARWTSSRVCEARCSRSM